MRQENQVQVQNMFASRFVSTFEARKSGKTIKVSLSEWDMFFSDSEVGGRGLSDFLGLLL